MPMFAYVRSFEWLGTLSDIRLSRLIYHRPTAPSMASHVRVSSHMNCHSVEFMARMAVKTTPAECRQNLGGVPTIEDKI